MSSPPEPAPAPRTKRRKIAIACNPCKSRKSRCDGVRPLCGPCSKKAGDRSSACSYRDNLPEPQQSFQIPNSYCPKSASDFDAATSEPRTDTASGARQYANSRPEYRPFSFNNIEDYPDQPQSLRVTHQLSIGSIDPLCSEYTETPSLTSNTGQTERSYDTVIRKPSSIKSEGTEGDSDGDAMGCVDNSALRAGLLGTSSGASFMHLVREVASDGSKTPDQGSKGAMAGHVSVTLRTVKHQAARNRDSRRTEFILPTRKTANYLMKVYWDYSHPIFPWLDKADVTKSYNLLWTGSEDPSVDEQVFHCTLNLIFAIACVLDPTGRAAELLDSSRIYYDRAKKLFSFDLLDFSYFPLLQAFLLMAQYLQSTKLPRKCFQSIGIAIWIAQDLGLHLPETTSSMKDLRERELARRVWHGCILLDKIAAMAFGRPLKISTQIAMQAVMPLAMDEERLEMHSPQPPDQPKLLDFYISFCRLHQILGDVLLTFYSPCGDTSAGFSSVKAKSFIESLDGLLEIDSRLVRFRNKLNPHLQVPSQFHDNTEIHVFERQANTLNLRWLHIRILLFRPFFSQTFQLRNSLAEQDTASLDFQIRSLVVSHCLVMCVRMAQQIIEIIHTNLISERSLNKLPPWWYNVTYVYNAATILIAAHMFPSVIEKAPASELRVSHEQALFILNHYEPFTQASSRCKSALEVLRKKIMLSPGDQPQMTERPGQVTSQSILGLSGDMANWGDITAYLPMVEGEELVWFNGQFFD